MTRRLVVRWLGRVPYERAVGLQDALVTARRVDRAPDTLLLLEHPPVVTLGRGADRAHVLLAERELHALGVALHECGRGGDVTYHGPGQLVGWPVHELPVGRRDLHRYLRDLEDGLIAAAADFGIEATRVSGRTGVWTGDRKVAAIGVRVSTGWITSHGFALNVTTDLSGFQTIVPCGIADRGVTSMAEVLGRSVAMPAVAARVAARIAESLGCEPIWSDVPAERLAARGTPGARGVAA